MRILFTGGGSGGHIYPLVAVAESLHRARRDAELFYIGVPGSYQSVLERVGIAVSVILSSKWRHYFDFRNFVDIPKFAVSFFQACYAVVKIWPDVLFSKGGPGALAVVLACRLFRVPVLIHESDAQLGLTNKLSSYFAQEVLAGFRSAIAHCSKPASVVGNPIRSSLLRDLPRQVAAKEYFGFDPRKPVILVLGGSQGAVRLNEFFLSIVPSLTVHFQVLHQTGNAHIKSFMKELAVVLFASRGNSSVYRAVPYFEDDYGKALVAADIIVSRASGSMFEFAALGRPAILIPFPARVHPHQVKNAQEYVKSGAGIMFDQDQLFPEPFLAKLNDLFAQSGRLGSMAVAAANFAKPNASEVIAQKLLSYAKKH